MRLSKTQEVPDFLTWQTKTWFYAAFVMQEKRWESHPQTMHVTVSPCVNLESLGAHEVKIAKKDSSDMLIKIRRQSSWVSQFHTTQQYPQIAGNLFQKKTDKCRNRWITNAFPTWKRRPYLQICTRRDCNITLYLVFNSWQGVSFLSQCSCVFSGFPKPKSPTPKPIVAARVTNPGCHGLTQNGTQGYQNHRG